MQCNGTSFQYFFTYNLHHNEMDYKEWKICRVETRFDPLVADWMEADLNASLQLIVIKGRSLCGWNVFSEVWHVSPERSLWFLCNIYIF